MIGIRGLGPVGLECARSQVLRRIREPPQSLGKGALQHHGGQPLDLVASIPDLIRRPGIGHDGASALIVLDDVGHRLDDVVDWNRRDGDSFDLNRNTFFDDMKPDQISARFLADPDEVGPVSIVEHILPQGSDGGFSAIDGHWNIEITVNTKVSIEKGRQAGNVIAMGVSDEEMLDCDLLGELCMKADATGIDADVLIDQVRAEQLGWAHATDGGRQ